VIPIPERMAHLPRDRRGYPIPWSVYHDATGRPHFQINDDVKRAIALARDWCPICANGLWRGRWFVGGPLSAFHPDGAYIDPPMHSECAHYALMACPYLAAPDYAKRIDARTLSKDDKSTMLLVDPTMIPERPEVFVALMTTGQERIGDNVRPRRPYSRIEYWRHGKQISEEEYNDTAGVNRAGIESDR
jgi:hypothetical protein